MADLGLTECCGDSNLRFEIWFRRCKAKDTFVLQAANLATKQAWTADISRLLWRQALHNKGRFPAHYTPHSPPRRAYVVPEGPQGGPRDLEALVRGEKVHQQQPIQG